MGTIKNVLREELNNSLQMEKDYLRELAKLPKGSLIKKKVKGHEYFYVISRENGKVKFRYKGKLSPVEIKRYKDVKFYRTKYRGYLSKLRKQIKFLRSSLRGKQSV
ncbi:MAG: hypothetical protein WC578_05145 [Candidatus Omnitrophota bacterium]|jgi:hypothetical protein